MRNVQMLDDRAWRATSTWNERHACNRDELAIHPCGMIVFAHERPSLTIQMRHRRNVDPAHSMPIVLNCFYVNPALESFWLLERRSVTSVAANDCPAEPLLKMLENVLLVEGLPFTTVVMDQFCATLPVLLVLDELEKAYWCRVRGDWAVTGDIRGLPLREADKLAFNRHTLSHGKLVVPAGCTLDHEVRLFKLAPHSCTAAFVATNQLDQDDVEAAQLMSELLDRAIKPERSFE